MTYDFQFSICNGELEFDCDFDMPAILYDQLKAVVKNFYKDEKD